MITGKATFSSLLVKGSNMHIVGFEDWLSLVISSCYMTIATFPLKRHYSLTITDCLHKSVDDIFFSFYFHIMPVKVVFLSAALLCVEP